MIVDKPELDTQMTDEQLAMVQLLSDPVTWAKHVVGWEARSYQEDILRDPNTRIVLRQGRRTGKTDVMVIKALYHAYLKIGGNPKRFYRVLLIAPMQEQVDEFFDRLRELIAQSPELSASVVEDKKHPQRVKFGNNAIIRGLSAGTKSGAKALSVRGKGADVLIYDEMDYLGDDDIANSYAIIQEKPDVYVIGASTPTGKRGWFYNWVNKSEELGFSAYHVPSPMGPEWSEKTEKELKLQFTGVKYLHEVMAEFGESETGVVQKKFLDAARARGEKLGLRYQSVESPLEKRGPRILGVDWDGQKKLSAA